MASRNGKYRIFMAKHPSLTTNGRIKVIVHDTYLEISVKVLRNIYVIAPLIFSALVWLFGLIFLVDKVFVTYRTIIEMGIAGMLFFWLLLGGILFSTLYWIFYGKERLLVTHDYIQTEKPIHLYKRKRAYPIEDISNIRVAKEVFKVRRNGVWEDDFRTVIRFETPYKNVVFGRGLSPSDAEFIFMELARSPYLKEGQFEPITSP